jgi:hypothetical protein
MTKHADVWLDNWTRSNVLSESRSVSDLDELLPKCLEDAAADGISKEALQEIAGGDLAGFIREAIIRSAGG